MTDRIIVDFHPFTVEQTINVYVDGNLIEKDQVTVDRVVDCAYGLSHKYNIDQIDLCGNSYYLSKFKAELNTKFDNNNFHINITNK